MDVWENVTCGGAHSLHAALDGGVKPAVPAAAENETKDGLRKEIEALRGGIASLEALVVTMPDLADRLAARKALGALCRFEAFRSAARLRAQLATAACRQRHRVAFARFRSAVATRAAICAEVALDHITPSFVSVA